MIEHLLQDATVWVAISFVIFCVGAFILAKDKVLGMLDGRIAAIRTEIETAEALRREAQVILEDYRRKQQEAASEAQTIIQNAQRHAEDIRRQAEADLSAASARREQQLQERLRRMQDALAQEIRTHAAALTVKATAEIIAEHMDDKSHARLVDDSIKQVAGQFSS